jgi:hypothetical protein
MYNGVKTTLKPTVDYISGLDLGQATDYTALAILQRTVGPDPKDPRRLKHHYLVQGLKRFEIGTAYTAICDRIGELYSNPPLAGSTLVVDRTGVGRAVTDLLKRVLEPSRPLPGTQTAKAPAQPKVTISPVTITAGQQANHADGGWNVPKKELVGALQILFQSGRIKVAQGISGAAVLTKELQTFKVKVTASANETFEAWRDGDHDDMVLAVAIAAWYGERFGPAPPPARGNPELRKGCPVVSRGTPINLNHPIHRDLR